MACCEGESVKYEDIMPPDIQKLRNTIANMLRPQIGKPAAGYPGPLSPGIDPNTMMAMAMYNKAMGGPGEWQMSPMMGTGGLTGPELTPAKGSPTVYPGSGIPGHGRETLERIGKGDLGRYKPKRGRDTLRTIDRG